jgi:hypothetical protein
VQAAEEPEEQEALESRYQAAMLDLANRRADSVATQFQHAATASKAVINRPLGELQRLANSDNQLYATYYQLVEAEVRVPADDRWNLIRAVADEALFPGYKRHIRMAALTLNEVGLSNYGECSLVLRDEMIRHRASVFEENSVTWMQRHNVQVGNSDVLPQGFRAVWEQRGKLALAKVASKLSVDTTLDEFPNLILKQGATSSDDEFIEVHIWGPLTRKSLERVIVIQPQRRADQVILKAQVEKLRDVDVRVEVQ